MLARLLDVRRVEVAQPDAGDELRVRLGDGDEMGQDV